MADALWVRAPQRLPLTYKLYLLGVITLRTRGDGTLVAPVDLHGAWHGHGNL